jgi:hypothetical protein
VAQSNASGSSRRGVFRHSEFLQRQSVQARTRVLGYCATTHLDIITRNLFGLRCDCSSALWSHSIGMALPMMMLVKQDAQVECYPQ